MHAEPCLGALMHSDGLWGHPPTRPVRTHHKPSCKDGSTLSNLVCSCISSCKHGMPSLGESEQAFRVRVRLTKTTPSHSRYVLCELEQVSQQKAPARPLLPYIRVLSVMPPFNFISSVFIMKGPA